MTEPSEVAGSASGPLWYNDWRPRRRHSALGYLSPVAFEKWFRDAA